MLFSYHRRLVFVYYLVIFWDACGRSVAAPCFQTVLAAVGLSRAFLLLAGILNACSLAAFTYKTAAYRLEEKQKMFVTIKTTEKNSWFDFTVFETQTLHEFCGCKRHKVATHRKLKNTLTFP